MATSKQYAYYLEGNKIAIVEKDVSFDNDLSSKDYGPGASRQRWESPQSTVTDGLKIKYVYNQTYTVYTGQKDETDIDRYFSSSNGTAYSTAGGVGKLVLYTDAAGADFRDGSGSVTDMSSVNHIVLENAGRFNGLHKINYVSTNYFITDTPFAGSTALTYFEETAEDGTGVIMYYNVSVLEDESFELDLPLYLQKALIYYIKGKLAEDAGEIK